MRQIKSYSLSSQLKAELNFSRRSSRYNLPRFSLDFKKIPFRSIAILMGVFMIVVLTYSGMKSLYEIKQQKNEKARAAKLQSYEERLAKLRDEIKGKGLDAAGYVELTSEYLKSKDIERAEEASTLAVELNPAWRDAYLNQGHVFLVSNKFEKAKLAFEKALEIDPLSGQGHYLLSLTYQELKDTQSAKAEFAKAKKFGFETEIGG